MEEISLRELIEVILKGKWFIAIFTAICMLISGIASFFFIKPVYEAQTMLMISPITDVKSEDTDNNRFFGLVGALSQYPQMTIDTYREQVKAPVILDYIRNELGLKNEPLRSIADKITVDVLKNTNLITISVKDNDPKAAAKIANLVSEKFTGFVSETNKKQAENSAMFIKEQQEKERQNLDKALEELKNFVSQPRGPEELKLEVDSKLQQLTDFKTLAVQIRIDEQAVRSSLEHGKRILSSTPQTFTTDKTILSDEFLSDIIKDKTNLSTSEIAGLKLSSEEISDIYVEAAKKVNELEVELSRLSAQRQNIEKEISARQKEMELLQAELAGKQQKFDILNHNVELIKQTYDAYQQKYKEAMIKQSAEIGKTSIIVVSQAIPSVKPVAPNKKLNVAIAMVLGLMVSVFAVFVREYWKNSSQFSVTSSQLAGDRRQFTVD